MNETCRFYRFVQEDMDNNFAFNVKRLRRERGWSQAELAAKVGSHVNHINRVEGGKYNPSLDTIIKLANVFEVPVDYLISGTDGSMTAVRIEDQVFSEKIKLLNSLNEDERKAVILFIDSLLSKKKLISLAKEMEN